MTFQPSIYWDKWNNAAVSHQRVNSTPSSLRQRHVLMAASYQYDQGFDTYYVITSDEFPMYADDLFVAPRDIAVAHENALSALADIERHLDWLRIQNKVPRRFRHLQFGLNPQ